MIQKIYSSKLMLGGVMAMLTAAGLAGCAKQAKNNAVSEMPQNTELVSKSASDSLIANFQAEQNMSAGNNVIKFNSAGKPFKEYSYYDNGILESQTLYSYSENGMHNEYTMYDDGTKWLRVYDSNDNIHQAVIFDENDSKDIQYVYAYAPDGSQKEIIYDGKGNVIQSYIDNDSI